MKSFSEIQNYYDRLYLIKREDAFPFDIERTRFITDHFTEGGKVLDIGCGVGNALKLMTEYDIYGTDISEIALNIARQRIPMGLFNLAREDNKIDLPSDYFDVVLCLGVLEHIVEPEIIIQETYRVLKKGGQVVFLVPNSLSPYFLFGGTEQIQETPRTKKEWKEMFKDFEIVAVKKDPGPTLNPKFPLVKKFKIFCHKLINLLPINYTYQFVFILRK